MSLKRKSSVAALAAAGCLIAGGAAQAAASLVTADHKPIHGAVAIYKYSGRAQTKDPVEDTGAGNLNQTVFIDGWALVDTVTCKEIGTPQLFAVPTNDKDGTWSASIISDHLGSGDCPKKTFTFSAISFTWTARAKVGAVDVKKMNAEITDLPKKAGLGKEVELLDTVTYTYTGK
jgi:hypothetical protein